MTVRYLAAAGVLLTGLAVSSGASASPAYATQNAEMREGPGAQFEVIAVIPARHPVDVIHCTFGYGWCEVVFLDYEGWVSGHYLRDDSDYVLYDFGPSLGIPLYEWTYRDLERRRDLRKRKHRRETVRPTIPPRNGDARPTNRREEKKARTKRRRDDNARRNETERTRVHPRTIQRGETRIQKEKDTRRPVTEGPKPERRSFRRDDKREGSRENNRARETEREVLEDGRRGPVTRRRYEP